MSKILVVDDDTATRHVLKSVLSNAGYTTSVAKDGVEALRIALAATEAHRNGRAVKVSSIR